MTNILIKQNYQSNHDMFNKYFSKTLPTLSVLGHG